MTLRKKTLLVQLALFAIFLLIIYLSFTFFLDRSAKQLDKRRMEQNLERVRSSLEGEANELYATSRIWANSDSTWNFMRGSSQSFSNINLDNAIINTLGISSMVLFDKSYNVKFFKDFINGDDPSAPVSEFESIIINNAKSSGLLSYIPISGLKGVATSNGKPLFFTIQPINNTNMDGDVSGYLLMTKSIDPNLVNRLSKKLHFIFGVEAASEREITNGVEQELVVWKDSDRDNINGRMLIRDVGGDPIFWVVGLSAGDSYLGINFWVLLGFLLLSVSALGLCLLGDQMARQLIWKRVDLTISALRDTSNSKTKPSLPDDGRDDELANLTLAINESYENSGFSKK